MTWRPHTTDEMPVLLSLRDLRRQLSQLQDRLTLYVERDPNCTVDGTALALVDTLMANAALYFSDHPVIKQMATGSMPPDRKREPQRASDLLIAVDLVLHSLP